MIQVGAEDHYLSRAARRAEFRDKVRATCFVARPTCLDTDPRPPASGKRSKLISRLLRNAQNGNRQRARYARQLDAGSHRWVHTPHQNCGRPAPNKILQREKIRSDLAPGDLVTGDERHSALQSSSESVELVRCAAAGVDEGSRHLASGAVNVMHALIGSAVRREESHVCHPWSPCENRDGLHVHVVRTDLLQLVCQEAGCRHIRLRARGARTNLVPQDLHDPPPVGARPYRGADLAVHPHPIGLIQRAPPFACGRSKRSTRPS